MNIQLEHIFKRYAKSIIFEDFSYEIKLDNEVSVLLGPNGAGKTTFLKLVSGIICPYKGDIILKGVAYDKYKNYTNWAHENVAYLSPDERYLSFKNNGLDNILYYGIIKGVSPDVIKRNLNDFMNYINCSPYINKRIEQLSTGQKKVIKLLSVFCTGLPVLLLDEPTVGLDVDTRDDLIEIIKQLTSLSKSTVIISTHDLEFAACISTKQVFIFNGKIKNEQIGLATTEDLKKQYNQWKQE